MIISGFIGSQLVKFIGNPCFAYEKGPLLTQSLGGNESVKRGTSNAHEEEVEYTEGRVSGTVSRPLHDGENMNLGMPLMSLWGDNATVPRR